MATSVTPTKLLAVLLLLIRHVTGDWTISGQYQYLTNTDKVYWDDGLNFCTQKKQTAFLARPTTENAEFLKSFGSGKMYWADHHYVGTKGWVWSDDSPLPVNDIQWHSGYPRSTAATNSRGLYERASATLMNTEANYLKFPVVCEAPLDPTTPAPTTTTPEPTTTTPQPTTTTPQPTTTTPQPTNTTPQPSTPTPLPTTPTPQPTTKNPEPTTIAPEPTTSTPQPTTKTPEPTTIAPKPATSTPEPTFAPTTASPVTCPSGDGWVDLGTGDGRCYYLSGEDPAAANLTWTWTGAHQACLDRDAKLASVPDLLTFYALSFRASAAGEDAWTGLLNSNIPGVGRHWSDGSEYNTELDQFIVNGTERYGYLASADGQFHLAGATNTRAFICYTDTSTPAPSTTPAPTASPCPVGWDLFTNTCYLFSEEQQYWTAAGHHCHELGANLVSIHHQTLINFLLVKAGDDVYWIGLQNQGNVYVWQDGSDTTDIALLESYLDKWEPGKDCVVMNKSLYPQFLVHDDCFAERRFVCQKPTV